MHTLVDAVAAMLQILALFLASTVAFDVVHVLLHRFEGSRFGTLRALGGLHAVHHRFADRDLEIHTELTADNIRWHVIPEYLTQLGFCMCLLPLLPARVVLGAVALQTLVFALILRARGMDVNHRPIPVLLAHRPSVFCLPRYHALHHAFPTAHFSSWIKLLDCVLGTGMALEGRRVAAAPGSFAALLCAQATDLGSVAGLVPDLVVDATADEQAMRCLSEIDVLIVDSAAPGVDAASLIERYLASTRGRKLPPEVWVIADAATTTSEPSAALATAGFFYDSRVIYRCIDVPAADRAGSDRTLAAARCVLQGIRRGFHFISTRGMSGSLAGRLQLRRAARLARVVAPA